MSKTSWYPQLKSPSAHSMNQNCLSDTDIVNFLSFLWNDGIHSSILLLREINSIDETVGPRKAVISSFIEKKTAEIDSAYTHDALFFCREWGGDIGC